MNRSRVTPVLIALLCISGLGITATTLETSLTTDPEEEIDPDWDRLPIGQDDAATIQQEMGDGGDESEGDDSGDDSEDDGSGESSESDGTGGGDRDSESDAADESGESGGERGDGAEGDGPGEPADGGAEGDGGSDGEANTGAGSEAEAGAERDDAGFGGPGDGPGSDDGAGDTELDSDGDAEQAGDPSDTGGEAEEAPGRSDQRDRDGSGPETEPGAGDPPLLDRLLDLLASLLWTLVSLVVLLGLAALAYRYREELLSAFDIRSPEENGTSEPAAAAEAWPGVTPSNVVDRAWVTVVRRVDPERPETITPAECVTLARERGLDAEAVEAIADAFERVHYGGAPVTEEAERARGGLQRLRGGIG